MKKSIIWLCILAIGILAYFFYRSNRWATYYQEKLSQPPRPFIVTNLEKIPVIEGNIALDLGSGVGNETLLLLQKGFHVIAVDNQKLAFDIMLKRPEFIPFKNKIKPLIVSFEKIPFDEIPMVDLIIASYALPFCSPESFEYVWNHMKNVLKSGGYFIGHLFDPGFTAFNKKDAKKMTFHTKEQTLDLFKDDFNIITFNEIKEPAKETGKFDHYYEIVARKR